MSLGTEDLFWEVLVFFIEGYSANSYDFGVLVRWGELGSFYSVILANLITSHLFLMPSDQKMSGSNVDSTILLKKYNKYLI